MSKNIAYIGLSSPIGFDYSVEQKYGRPNPVLEAPLGLFLLYDEIWFAHHELCPVNMENLEYVKIMSDSNDMSDFAEKLKNMDEDDILDEASSISLGRRLGDTWQRVIEVASPESATPDDHGRNPVFGWGMPRVSYDNFLFDQYLTDEYKLDYVSNSAVADYIQFENTEFPIEDKSVNIANTLVMKRVPQYQSPVGPYFEEIDDFRNSKFISRFRNEMRNVEQEADVEELEFRFNRVRNKMQKRATDPKNIYDGVAKLALDVVPVVSETLSTIVDLEGLVRDKTRYYEYGWASLLAEVEDEFAVPPDGAEDR